MSIRNSALFFLVGFLAFLSGTDAQDQCACVKVTQEWDGNYQAKITVQTTVWFIGLRVNVTFSEAVDGVDYWTGKSQKIDDTHFYLSNDQFQAKVGDTVEVEIQVHFKGNKPLITDVIMNEDDICDGSGDWTTPPPMVNPCEPTGMKPYDYSQVLCMSYLFYEAQRSGPLPNDQRVTWRGDSALGDGSDVHLDLTGGYYDAGDHVKFGFPMAFSTTMLAWGLLDFAEGNNIAKQDEYAKKTIRWATDYFLKAHSAKDTLYGQVGTGSVDHAYWGRPEDMTMPRPAMKIDDSKPGSDLAGETAAALAAAYLVFKNSDSDYAKKLLASAEELYAFADAKRGVYSNSITDAAGFYKSWSGYGDELCWGALWLARATGDKSYITKAKGHWDAFKLGEGAEQFSWDDKKGGVYALFMLLEPSNSLYSNTLQGFLDHVRNDDPYTPGGLVYLDQWGANRHAANVAYLALWAAKQGLKADTNRKWAEGQMNYLLGDVGHSFVVGYGVDPPERPHHRSSSCPSPPAPCETSWAQQQPGPNPHVLYGALVGGPDKDGSYKDDRMDYVHNEVACDYNAAFTGALAAMTENHKNSQF